MKEQIKKTGFAILKAISVIFKICWVIVLLTGLIFWIKENGVSSLLVNVLKYTGYFIAVIVAVVVIGKLLMLISDIGKKDKGETDVAQNKTGSIITGLHLCENGHLYENTKECPYCSILKDFNLSNRTLSLEEIRMDRLCNINLKDYIHQQFTDDTPIMVDGEIVGYPRDFMLTYFKEVPPIKGGWGYSIEDAIIFDSDKHMDCIALEYQIAKFRIVFHQTKRRPLLRYKRNKMYSSAY